MDRTTLTSPSVVLRQGELNHLTSAITLYETFQHLPDPRRRQGKRYDLALLFCLIVLAKLAGQTTLKGATEWIRHRADTIAAHFGLKRAQMPCQVTYCRMLARVDAKVLDELLAAYFVRWEAQQRCGSEPVVCRPGRTIWTMRSRPSMAKQSAPLSSKLSRSIC